MNFPENLKRLRLAKNVTQLELANYLHVSRPTIAGYETKSKQPDYTKLLMLSEFFQVSVDYLLTGRDGIPSLPSAMIESAEHASAAKLTEYLIEDFECLSPQAKVDTLSIVRLFKQRDHRLEAMQEYAELVAASAEHDSK